MTAGAEGSDPFALRPAHPALVAGAGGVLVWGAAAGPHLFDAGELVAAAWDLGGSHPPGQPLHAILGHAAALLPIGPIALRVALISIAGELVAAWLISKIVATVVAEIAEVPSWARIAAPNAAFLGAVIAPPLLRQAVRVEVYGIALALALLAVWAILRWSARLPGASGALRVAALAAGLAATVHPPHALAALLVGAAALALGRRDVARAWRALGWAAAACGAGLLLYAWLPVRAAAGAPMWGAPETWGGFVDYVTASAYRQNLAGSGGSVVDTVLYVVLASGTAGAAGTVAMVTPVAKLDGRARTLGVVLAVGAALTLGAALLQPLQAHIPDFVAYAGPVVALLIAGGVIGFVALARFASTRAIGGLGIALMACNATSIRAVPETLAADVPALETLGGALADAPPPRALVLASTDYTAATWMMARSIDGARPDVALLITGLATSSWHWRSLAPHPGFDGRPVRGGGPTAEARLVDGALRTAFGSFPIAAELDAPTAGHGMLTGSYLVIDPGGDTATADGRTTVRDGVAATSIGERLEHAIDADAARSPRGDSGAAEAILDFRQVERARRLLARRRPADALLALRRAMRDRPERERALLRVSAPRGTRVAARVPVVRDPAAFLIAREDVVREAAVLLHALGHTERALTLLESQTGRGDPRSVLQLAWIALAEGDLRRARAAHQAFLAAAPDLAGEAAPLAERLP